MSVKFNLLFCWQHERIDFLCGCKMGPVQTRRYILNGMLLLYGETGAQMGNYTNQHETR
jgi:hypothetical protein